MTKKVQRSNAVHYGLARKYRKPGRKQCISLAQYHSHVARLQANKNKVISRKQRAAIKRRMAPGC